MNASAVLTCRQDEIAELLSWGAIKKEVADYLHISVRTVENHTRQIQRTAGYVVNLTVSAVNRQGNPFG